MGIWAGVSAIAAAIQTAILIAAAYYALTQVREARKIRLLNVITSLRHDLDSTESRQNRYALFNELPDDLTSSLTVEQDQIVDRVVVEYDNLGSLTINGFIDFELLASLYANSTERSWRRAEPWIQKERKRRNGATYAPYFEEFAGKCIAYNALKHPEGLETFKRAVKQSKDKHLRPRSRS